MMRKVISAMCLISMVFAAGVFAQSEPIKLTYSCFFPPTHIQSKLAEEWCKEVENRTGGKVKVEYYAGQTLTKANQCYDGVVEGLSDIGFSVLAYTRGRFPLMSAVDLPFGYTSGIGATSLVNKVYEKFKPAELDDTKVMYLHAHGPGLIHTKGKPVKKLEDVSGLKLRSHGTSADFVKSLGGAPVAQPMPETYQSLQKGVVDGAVYPLESNKGWRLGEVVTYCTANFSVAYTTAFFVVMNKAKWNSIPPDIQKTIEEINTEWASKHGEAWDTSDMIGLRYFLDQGNELIGLSSKESERWKKAVEPMIEDYIKVMDSKGIKGKEVVDFIRQNLSTAE